VRDSSGAREEELHKEEGHPSGVAQRHYRRQHETVVRLRGCRGRRRKGVGVSAHLLVLTNDDTWLGWMAIA
jgi:hypothetical protein